MGDCLERVNNCLHIFTSCLPKDNSNNINLNNSTKTPKMNEFYTLILPTRPKIDDEIKIKAKLKENPREFVINLCVDSILDSKEDEPMMIAFHFRTKFKGHSDDTSYVVMNCKRGHDGWDDIEELDNTWIDDDVDEIDIMLRFTKRNIQFFQGSSLEYQFEHQYEINRIDRLQIGGDLEYIEEVALRYKKSF